MEVPGRRWVASGDVADGTHWGTVRRVGSSVAAVAFSLVLVAALLVAEGGRSHSASPTTLREIPIWVVPHGSRSATSRSCGSSDDGLLERILRGLLGSGAGCKH